MRYLAAALVLVASPALAEGENVTIFDVMSATDYVIPALELIAAKKQADLDRILRTWDDSDVQILKGRWGPFISDGKKNARMPKDREVESLTLEECLAALEAAPDKRRGKKATKKKAAKKKATKKRATKKKTAKKKSTEKKTEDAKTASN